MLEEIFMTVSELVELADRNVTRIFADPWPPVDTKPPATCRVVYAKQETCKQISSRAVVHPSPTLRPRANVSSYSGRTIISKARPPQKTGEIASRPVAKLRKPIQRKTSPPIHTTPTPAVPRPVSAPSAIGGKSDIQENKILPKLYPVELRRAQSLRPDDFRLDLTQCDVLVIAVAEMEVCKELFAGWRAQLSLGDPRRTDKLELSIISTVRRLDIGASAALQASHSLLRNYKALLNTVERNLGRISQSKSGGSPFSPEISSLASSISAHSRALSSYVKQIQERLRTLVRDIEKTKESSDKRALKRKIWKWITRVFKVLGTLISVGGAIFAVIHPVGFVESITFSGASMLTGAAARLCELIEESYSETTFDEILTFLRSHIPESAKAAEIALTSFQACHRILQVELEVRKGNRSGWLSSRDAERARGQWAMAEQKLQTPRI